MPKEIDSTNQARRDTIAEIIACMAWEPKNIDQVMETTGCAESTARAWIDAFHRSGLVYIAERLPRQKAEGAMQYTRRRIMWAWQTKPFAMEDAPQ